MRREADFAHSLADLMSGVAVTFLVIAAIFMVQASQAKRSAQAAKESAEKEARDNQVNAENFQKLTERDQRGINEIKELRERLDGIPSINLAYDERKDPRLLTIVFDPASLRFASGACEVNREQEKALRETLRAIFPSICEAVGADLHKIISLEGHTDNQPPLSVSCKTVSAARGCRRDPSSERCRDEGFESNVRLSAARAQYVFFQARDALEENAEVAACLDSEFQVIGHGPKQPLDDQPWQKPRDEATNERHRRVVIKVRVTAEPGP